MAKTGCRVLLTEIAEQSGWGVEEAIQHLKIVVTTDWANRPCVDVADARRLMEASRAAADEWFSAQNQRLEQERSALRAPRKRRAPISRVFPGGQRNDPFPGESVT